MPGVDHAAADHLAGLSAHGQGLPGQHRLVERSRLGEPAVRGHDVPGGEEQGVTRRDQIHVDLMHLLAVHAAGYPRGALCQQVQLPLGASLCALLEVLAAADHDGDDGRREELSGGQGADDGQQGQDVHTAASCPQSLHHGDCGGHGTQHTADSPDPLSGPGHEKPDHQQRSRHDQQQSSRPAHADHLPHGATSSVDRFRAVVGYSDARDSRGR